MALYIKEADLLFLPLLLPSLQSAFLSRWDRCRPIQAEVGRAAPQDAQTLWSVASCSPQDSHITAADTSGEVASSCGGSFSSLALGASE